MDTSDCTMMNIAEHYMASDVEWDPTGRYVVTSVSWWSHKVMLPCCGRFIDTAGVYLSNICAEQIILPPRLSSCAGGQRILVVDVSGPAPSEEQQRSLLSAALETQTSLPAQCRPNQGTDSPLPVIPWGWGGCGARDDRLNNFSDTSYESCPAAPDSKPDLRLRTDVISLMDKSNPDG